MKYFLTMTLLFLATLTWAQPEDAEIQTINGERVYVHVVQGGNTLWGIHQLYNVPVEAIVKRNPGVETGIKEGQVLYIPVPVVSKDTKHIVQSGETLFGISRKYGVSVDDLIKWNPGVENGLKVDQELIIQKPQYANDTPQVQPVKPAQPEVKVTFSDSIVEHVVMEHETFYSISRRYMIPSERLMEFNNKKNTKIKPGEVLRIPLKKERIEHVEVRQVPEKVNPAKIDTTLLFPKRDEYHVAILMPFFLDRGAGYSEQVSDMAAEFLMGAQMALDSLESLGFRAKVHVYDTRNDSLSIMKVLSTPEFKQMDLVIGPLFKDKAMLIAKWCKQNGVRMVCPVSVDTRILQNNPFVYTAVTSDITLMKGLAKYTYDTHKNDKVIIVKPTSPKDSVLYEAFRSEFNRLGAKTNTRLVETTPGGFSAYLTRSANVVLVYPTNDRAAVTKFFNEMGRFIHKTSDEKTFVFGTNEWVDFESVNAFYKNKYKLTYANPQDLNYQYDKTKYYLRKYRSLYRSDMSKMAVQGFDVTFNYCAELLMGKPVGTLIMNDFENVQVGPGNGFENTRSCIISQRDYELINVANGLK